MKFKDNGHFEIVSELLWWLISIPGFKITCGPFRFWAKILLLYWHRYHQKWAHPHTHHLDDQWATSLTLGDCLWILPFGSRVLNSTTAAPFLSNKLALHEWGKSWMSRYWCFPFSFLENGKCILNLEPEKNNILKGWLFFSIFSHFRILPVPCLASGGLTPDVNENVKSVKYQHFKEYLYTYQGISEKRSKTLRDGSLMNTFQRSCKLFLDREEKRNWAHTVTDNGKAL